MLLEITLPPSYADRIVKKYDGCLYVYGDGNHTLFLGEVKDQNHAVQLLDGYDSQLERRQVIADILDKQAADALQEFPKENFDA